MKSTHNTLNKAKIFILDFLFPEKCVGCKKRGNILCDKCTINLRRAERETSSNIIAVYDYRDPLIKSAIWSLKYYKRQTIGVRLGTLIYDALIEDIADIKVYTGDRTIYVIPIPISKSRKRARGYNQAECIARGFIRESCDESPNVLEIKNDIIIRSKDVGPQARIANRNKRLENIKGAFKINNPEQVSGRTIIVIDDVTTTGGTLLETIKLLKKAGAKKVVGFAVAH